MSNDCENIKACMEAGTHPARPFAPIGFPVYHNAHQATVRMAWDIINAADWTDRALADTGGRPSRYAPWSELGDASVKATIDLLANMHAPNYRQWVEALDAEARDALQKGPGLAARIEHEEWAASGQSISGDLWGKWDDEARDAWIYQQCCDHRPHRDIIAFIDDHPTWPKITSPAGILTAARRYAKANKLPPPPSRYKKRNR